MEPEILLLCELNIIDRIDYECSEKARQEE